MKTHKKSRVIMYISLIYIILIMFITIGSLIFFRKRSMDYSRIENPEDHTYSKHYVLVGEEDVIESLIYENVLEEAKKNDAYVELFGKDLSVAYDKEQLLRMAIDSSVDGIILVGDDSKETYELINEAVEADIPVVTVGEDSPDSSRQCFIGVTSYNLGNKYAKEILNIIQNSDTKENTIKIGILVEGNTLSSSQNIILLAIRSILDDSLKDAYKIDIQTVPVDDKSIFSVEDNIRDILLDERNIPDILLCMNDTYSECVYRAIVDYNMVGTMNIIGFGDSDSVVNAVTKNIFYSSIYFDTANMGNMCVQALIEYYQMGYVSSYMPVDTIVIHNEEAVIMSEEAKNR